MTIREAEEIIRNHRPAGEKEEVTSKYNIAMTIVSQAIRQGYKLNAMTHKEMVNHPKHYNANGRKECIVEMEELYGKEATAQFCLLSAYKYLYRKDMKGKRTQDIDKAKWYLMYIEQHLEPSSEMLGECKDLMKQTEVEM